VYLFETFKGNGVQLATEELGVKGINMGFEAGHVYLSTVLGLHFVPGMKRRSET